ncbi:MAG: DUF362 domain-containing protein, partial [Planctomycetota bacterium]
MASELFFIPVTDISNPAEVAARAGRVADAVGLGEIAGEDLIFMLKIHFGEPGNDTYIRPEWVCPLIECVQDAGSSIFVSDTNTLYAGSRGNAVDHLTAAHEHGFTQDVLGAP